VNADLSVAPEIAQLAVSPASPPPQAGATPAPHTAGRIAADLSSLAAAPQRWWDLVRFDPDGPARTKVPGAHGAWLLVLPPGATAACDCRYATLLAGQAAESPLPPHPAGQAAESPLPPHPAAPSPAAAPPDAPPPPASAPAPARPLRPGRVRVHGRHATHQIRGGGHGYSVSLHWADGGVRPEEIRDYYPERPVAPVLHPPLRRRRRLSSPGCRGESSLRPTRGTTVAGETMDVSTREDRLP
jgi:hypothetical protein